MKNKRKNQYSALSLWLYIVIGYSSLKLLQRFLDVTCGIAQVEERGVQTGSLAVISIGFYISVIVAAVYSLRRGRWAFYSLFILLAAPVVIETMLVSGVATPPLIVMTVLPGVVTLGITWILFDRERSQFKLGGECSK